jgi:hypothetical protein
VRSRNAHRDIGRGEMNIKHQASGTSRTRTLRYVDDFRGSGACQSGETRGRNTKTAKYRGEEYQKGRGREKETGREGNGERYGRREKKTREKMERKEGRREICVRYRMDGNRPMVGTAASRSAGRRSTRPSKLYRAIKRGRRERKGKKRKRERKRRKEEEGEEEKRVGKQVKRHTPR